ncbi:HIT family protein [Acidianus manzaensis]|uniref:HIT family protein n=1 Tax=Acidianus manzaensis TaxID=282676 RepID=A0A1W6JXM6_9CREN|nr:HIT family protein [Acidianus manzaensis]ARM74995.1 HIT family protein [Acidianus manzaensis]
MCLFCNIIKGEEHAFIVYEDKNTMAFLDKYPLSPGHTLVVTKTHFDNFLQLDKEHLSQLSLATNIVANAISKSINASGMRILTNIGKSAGQVIFHVHVHIIPTWDSDLPKEFNEFEPRKEQTKEYYETLKRVISQNIKTIIADIDKYR